METQNYFVGVAGGMEAGNRQNWAEEKIIKMGPYFSDNKKIIVVSILFPD